MPPLAIWASAVVVAVIQVAGSFGAAHDQPKRLAIDAVGVALLLAGPAALGVRTRWPLVGAGGPILAADLYLGRGYPYGPVFLSVIVGLVYAVLVGERRRVWVVAGAGLVGYSVATWALGPRSAQPSVLHLLVVAGWLIVVLSVAEIIRAQRLEATERARRRTSDERLGIARDVHDVLAHHISMINVQAGVALHLFDEQPEQARTALTNIKEASRDALHELRSALDVLRYGDEHAARAPAPGLADIERLVAGVRAGGLDVHVETSGDVVALPASLDGAAYRIVQEALTNVTRHARARHAVVRVDFGPMVVVEVRDDGRGGTPVAGNGIVGMRERAEAFGGTVEAGPHSDGGFAVVARLPVPS